MRKRSGVPSGELSDTRRLGSADARWYTSQGEKAVFRRRSIAARNAVKTPGKTAWGAGARPRCDATRRTRPEVPSAVTVGAAAGRNPRKRDESRRTATRRRICIRRAVARTRESAIYRRRAPLRRSKPHDVRQTSTGTSHTLTTSRHGAEVRNSGLRRGFRRECGRN